MNSSKKSSGIEVEAVRKVIRGRRSIFPQAYTDEEVSDGIINQMLENANYAPTHKLTQPWRFKVVRGKALDRLSGFMEQYYIDNTPTQMISEKKREIWSKV